MRVRGRLAWIWVNGSELRRTVVLFWADGRSLGASPPPPAVGTVGFGMTMLFRGLPLFWLARTLGTPFRAARTSLPDFCRSFSDGPGTLMGSFYERWWWRCVCVGGRQGQGWG